MSKRPRGNSIGSIGSIGSDPDAEDYDERRHRNRERNKEHARKTRVRKKEQLQALKSRVSELEEEGRRLKQSIQECSVASILLGLSAGSASAAAGGKGEHQDGILPKASGSPSSNFGASLACSKRKRFLSLDGEDPTPPPMQLNIKGQITLVGGPSSEGKTNINWKTGVYVDDQGKRQQLTKSELETLRRERNRMHAKMTRDRKKCFIASLKRVISRLEEENKQLHETLERSTHAEDASVKPFSEEEKSGDLFYSRPFPASGAIHQGSTATPIFSSNIYTVGHAEDVGVKPSSEEKKSGDLFYSRTFPASGAINQGNTATSMFSSNIYTVG